MLGARHSFGSVHGVLSLYDYDYDYDYSHYLYIS